MPFNQYNVTIQSQKAFATLLDEDGASGRVCTLEITLRARVSGANNRTTFRWEQVSGSIVDWLSPNLNRVEVVYTTSTFDVKKFRFILDEGTPNEQSFEHIVFTGGLSNARANANVSTSTFSMPSFVAALRFSNITSGFEGFTCSVDTPTLTWKHPVNGVPDYYLLYKRLSNGVWELVTKTNATEYYPVELDTLYKVSAKYGSLVVDSNIVPTLSGGGTAEGVLPIFGQSSVSPATLGTVVVVPKRLIYINPVSNNRSGASISPATFSTLSVVPKRILPRSYASNNSSISSITKPSGVNFAVYRSGLITVG